MRRIKNSSNLATMTGCLALALVVSVGCFEKDGGNTGNTGGRVGDVLDVNTNGSGDSPGQDAPDSGAFDARVINDSSTAADVLFVFSLDDRIVHQTNLRGVMPGESIPIAGPEVASKLVVTGARESGEELPTQEFTFGIDVTSGQEAIYTIIDSIVTPP
ncbi:MAG: hypothetical protein KDA54_01775, partial [Phycisphaerales bacterium]|nr:hypothetical protein [Phycisphaerales bacterium]